MIEFGIAYEKNGVVLYIEENKEEYRYYLTFEVLRNLKKLINSASEKVEFFNYYKIEFK